MGSNNGKPGTTAMHNGFVLITRRPFKDYIENLCLSNIAEVQTSIHMLDLAAKSMFSQLKSDCVWLVVVLITIDTGSRNDCNECHQCSIVAAVAHHHLGPTTTQQTVDNIDTLSVFIVVQSVKDR